MILTFIFALMTAAAVLAVLWPLWKMGRAGRAGSDVEVYRDQLDEIERDHAAGLIGKPEADAARVEVSRRLIAAVDGVQDQDGEFAADGASAIRRRRAVAAVALLLLPLCAGSVYYFLGSPGIPTLPLAERLNDSSEQNSIDGLVAQVEAYLEHNPEDGRGWEVLAPIYARSGQYDDAVKAWRNALRLLGESAEREAYLGESLVAAANGIVTAEAKSAFDRALAIDANSISARFYLGLAAEQDGRREEAAKIWRNILASASEDAHWVGFVREALARVEGKPVAGAPGPNAQDVAAAAKLAPEQQSVMIQNMVDRLAERLKTESSDFDGWLRLMRSYQVLGQTEKARAAAENARRVFAGDPEKLRQLDEAIKGLNQPLAGTAGPSVQDVEAAAKLAPEQQSAMIQNMVDRLAERLKTESSDFDGWLRLMRSYKVLGQTEKARAATETARRAFAGEPEKLRQLDEAIKGLGL